jgi:uncharacterized protein YigE (DUF2233 family)
MQAICYNLHMQRQICYIIAVLFTLIACSAQVSPVSTGTPVLAPLTSVPRIGAAEPTALPVAPADGWQAVASGVALRELTPTLGPDRPPARVLAVRFDPAVVRLRVGYAPGAPQPLSAWATANPAALLVINGGFFTPEQRATALVIADGVPSGTSYSGFGGMLAVTEDGTISLRPLRDQPYDPAEPLREAVQSFPMLVFPGGVPAEPEDDGARTRRTAVAFDREGRLLFIVCPGANFTLTELAQWLANGELQAERALNLDGGSSTGMLLRAGATRREVEAFVPLPEVLLIEPR